MKIFDDENKITSDPEIPGFNMYKWLEEIREAIQKILEDSASGIPDLPISEEDIPELRENSGGYPTLPQYTGVGSNSAGRVNDAAISDLDSVDDGLNYNSQMPWGDSGGGESADQANQATHGSRSSTPPDCFLEILKSIWLGKSFDQAIKKWKEIAERSSSEARQMRDCWDSVIDDPPNDLVSLLEMYGGIPLRKVEGPGIMRSYTRDEAVEWLKQIRSIVVGRWHSHDED